VLGGIGVAGANVASLEGLEVLEGAQLVSHGESCVEVGWRRRRCGEVEREDRVDGRHVMGYQWHILTTQIHNVVLDRVFRIR
jgi:hypothetical protein